MIIHQGAEAVIMRKGDQIIKKRIKKGYRITELDEKIRRQRTKLESSLLMKAKRMGVQVPRVFEVEKYEITMEFLPGKRVKEALESNEKKIGELIGETIAELHQAGIMHGDLTTSNMIFNKSIWLIDFGLSKHSSKIEDQAVDLFLLYEALKATTVSEKAWSTIINTYKKQFPNAKEVCKQIEKIKQRRRYKN